MRVVCESVMRVLGPQVASLAIRSVWTSMVPVDGAAVRRLAAGELDGHAAADLVDVGLVTGRRGRPWRDGHLTRADRLAPGQRPDHVADGPPGGPTGLREGVVPVAVVPVVGVVVARVREIGGIVVGGRVVVLVGVVHDPRVHVVVVVVATRAPGGCHEQRTQCKRCLFPLHELLLGWRLARRVRCTRREMQPMQWPGVRRALKLDGSDGGVDGWAANGTGDAPWQDQRRGAARVLGDPEQALVGVGDLDLLDVEGLPAPRRRRRPARR